MELRTVEIYVHSMAFQGIINQKLNENLFTPSNISVSSKHVLAIFDDGHGVWSMVATGVEGAYSPAVRGGAVAQQPL